MVTKTIQMSRSSWTCGLRRASAVGRFLAFRVWIPPSGWLPIFCECCVSSVIVICFGADHSAREVLASVVCLCMSLKPQNWGGPGLLGLFHAIKNNLDCDFVVQLIYWLGYRMNYRKSRFESCAETYPALIWSGTDHSTIKWVTVAIFLRVK